MLRRSFIAFLLVSSNLPCLAQGMDVYGSGATGAQARTTGHAGGSLGSSQPTGNQSLPLPRTALGGLAPAVGDFNGLLPTTNEPFIPKFGGHANAIVGDEGTNGPPEIEGFNRQNRIDFGLTDSDSNDGLTTQHQSRLPSAAGRDEFIGGPEMSISGNHVLPGGQGNAQNSPFDPAYGFPETNPGGYYDPSAGPFAGADGK